MATHWIDAGLFAGSAVAVLLSAVLWTLAKRDRADDRLRSGPSAPPSPGYRSLAPINKARVLATKLADVRRAHFGRHAVLGAAAVRDAFARVRRVQAVSELQYREALLQCTLAVAWLEEPAGRRNRRRPPEPYEPYKPLTADDVKQTRALVASFAAPRPRRHRRRCRPASRDDGPPSLPRVDRWLWNAAVRVARNLDEAYKYSEELWSQRAAADVATDWAKAAADLARGTVSVDAAVDAASDNVQVTVNVMLPADWARYLPARIVTAEPADRTD